VKALLAVAVALGLVWFVGGCNRAGRPCCVLLEPGWCGWRPMPVHHLNYWRRGRR
jgi:hypothetical protein